MEKKNYKVKLEVYEGPLNLLLHLIKRDEVDIHDISIENLTQQYNEYLNTFKELNIPLASEFIVMTANLMLLKSKTLLPRQLLQDDDEDVENSKWNLIRQLLEYKKFKEAAHALDEKQSKHSLLFPHHSEQITPLSEIPSILEQSSAYELVDAFKTVMTRFQQKQEIGEVLDDQFNVPDKIDYLLDLITKQKRKSFDSLFNKASSKQEIIVTFLALLELVKLRKLSFTQDHLKGEIIISRTELTNA